MNENCLAGLRCPNCGNDERLIIDTNVVFSVEDEGTDGDYGDVEWDDYALCSCPKCDQDGTIWSFTMENACSPEESEESANLVRVMYLFHSNQMGKLFKKLKEGYRGWDDIDMHAYVHRMLVDELEKDSPDWVDVANLAMMLRYQEKIRAVRKEQQLREMQVDCN